MESVCMYLQCTCIVTVLADLGVSTLVAYCMYILLLWTSKLEYSLLTAYTIYQRYNTIIYMNIVSGYDAMVLVQT